MCRPSKTHPARDGAMDVRARVPDIPASEIVLEEVLGTGEGNQGEVRRARWRAQDVAVKRLTDGTEAGANERAAKEVQRLALATVNNAHVCR